MFYKRRVNNIKSGWREKQMYKLTGTNMQKSKRTNLRVKLLWQVICSDCSMDN